MPKESKVPEHELDVNTSPKPKQPRPRRRKYRSSSTSDFSLMSIRSSRSRQLFLPGRKIHLKKFYYYIKNSKADQNIVSQMNSKHPISYMRSDRSYFYRKSSIPSISNKNMRTGGSVISTTNISNSLLSPRKSREMEQEDEPNDTDELLFDTYPEEYYPDDGLKKSISDILVGISNKAEKGHKKSSAPKRDKHKPKPSDSYSEDSRSRQSILTMRSVGNEIKSRESQESKYQSLREQVRQSFYMDERAAVQARIQELMKQVAIRKDYRPPKPPRDFMTENILEIPKRPAIKKPEVEKKVKPRRKFPTLKKILTVPEDSASLSNISKRIYNKYFPEALKHLNPSQLHSQRPLRIRRYSDRFWKEQQDRYQSKNLGID
uniref:Uncharacterized protein LOC108050632 n=1 Tax=Drosophila rhopaloa TaxID=1041015 RepID=A0A6P4FKC1_DRORH